MQKEQISQFFIPSLVRPGHRGPRGVARDLGAGAPLEQQFRDLVVAAVAGQPQRLPPLLDSLAGDLDGMQRVRISAGIQKRAQRLDMAAK